MASIIPDDLRYTKEHEWARLEGDTVIVGITDYAQKELSDIVYVELPEVGSRVEAMQPFATIEAVKTVSDLYAPLMGEIVEINALLKENPSLVNRDPYGEGWIIKIRLEQTTDYTKLLDAHAYRQLVGETL